MKTIYKDKLKTKHFELHYPQENMICHKKIIPTKLHFSLYYQLVKIIGVLPNVSLQYEELKRKI